MAKKSKEKVTVVNRSSRCNISEQNAPTELFSDIKESNRKNYKLDLTYEIDTGKSVNFSGFEPLDFYDLHVLQGIIGLLTKKGIKIEAIPGKSRQERVKIFFETNLLR